ncbi:MAG: tRNA-dihydrouridine synthase family protein [Bacilli bacterium]|jgi:nifR3 family TIM-barrel protein
MSFKIGDVEIKGKVILAPMAGITSFSYRKFMMQFHPALVYTEMVSDCGLIYDNQKTLNYLKTDGTDKPLAVQLFGGKTEELVKATKIVENECSTYEILDLNLGCPVNKVIKNNGGSSWLKDQDELFKMVSEVVKNSKRPVSCKIRLGFNTVNVEETVKTLEKAGCKFIAVHARTRAQGYTGKADYSKLKNIRDLITIPFCVGGDIYSVADAQHALEETRADAVMVARGAVGNPELISNINLALEGKPYNESVSFLNQYKYLKDYTKLLVNEYGEERAISLMRGIAPKFFLKVRNSKALRVELASTIIRESDIYRICDKYISRLE